MINSISSNTTNYSNKQVQTKKQQEEPKKSETKQQNDGVVYEPSSEKVSEQDKKISMYKDKDKIEQMLNQADLQTKNFEKLVSSLFDKQANKFALAQSVQNGSLKDFFKNITADAETIAKAKKDISEDGYYGVNKTSERIVDFAKAIAGNNPEKLQEMRDAVEKGFKKAEEMWGGELPEISKQTYDKVMSTFDELQGIKAPETEQK